jgi:hypothetical protein
MSYSLNNKCGVCLKRADCLDGDIIQGAISTIYSIWPSGRGHLGSGTVTLDCQNFEAMTPPEPVGGSPTPV